MLFDPNTYWMKHEDHTQPINGLARALRTFTCYPQQVDECGTLVPQSLLEMARTRNLQLVFGPRAGQFSIVVVAAVNEEGAVRNVLDVHGLVTQHMYAVGQVVVPREPASFSAAPARAEVTELLLQFRTHDRMDKLGVRGGGDDGRDSAGQAEPVALFDMFILACIFVNGASSCMEHFMGTAVMVEEEAAAAAADHCCDAACAVRSEERCPRGLVKMAVEWYTLVFVLEAGFNLVFTLEMLVKIVSWQSLRKYLSYNYPSNVLDALIVVTSDVFFVLEFFTSGLFNASILRLVRLVRAVRAFKTFQAMKRLKVIIDKAAVALQTCSYVLLILVLWHVAMALLGMQVYHMVWYVIHI